MKIDEMKTQEKQGAAGGKQGRQGGKGSKPGRRKE